MLVAFPEAAFSIFKRSGLSAFVKVASRKAVFGVSDLIAGGISRKEAYLILRDLQNTEHVRRVFGGFSATNITPASITVNLRDVRSDVLFKYAGTRALLYSLHRGKNVAEVSRSTNLSERHLSKVKRTLKDLGVIVGRAEINPRLIKSPSDPLEVVPVSKHREVLKTFMNEFKEAPQEVSIVFHGKASWGLASPSLSLLIIHRGLLAPEEQEELIAAAVKSAKAIHEAIIELTFTAMETWIMQKHGLVANPSPTLDDAFEGIFIAGREPTLEDLFEENLKATKLGMEDLLDMLNRGLIEASSGRYRFTEKALRKMRRSPSIIVEDEIEVMGKRVRLISSRPP